MSPVTIMGHMADALEAGYLVDYRRGVLLTLHASLSFGLKDVLTMRYCSPSMLSWYVQWNLRIKDTLGTISIQLLCPL